MSAYTSITKMAYLPEKEKTRILMQWNITLTAPKAKVRDKGTLISSTPASTNSNLNFEVYIAQNGNQTSKPKGNFASIHVGCGGKQ
jgi:hypothetical protein